jgi:three-Cys-motif partner protein
MFFFRSKYYRCGSENLMAAQGEQGHRFGGVWTELKLDAVHYYLGFFTRVLKKPFELWYIDAFAGSGSRTEMVERGGLLEGTPIEMATAQLAGSVMRALSVEPPFNRHIFIEGNTARFRELEAIRDETPDKRIECRHGDANNELCSIFTSQPWSKQIAGKGYHRAVVFLDPYGMNVEWDTLQLLANTQAVDVWYLFPLQAVTRQLSGVLDKVDSYKQDRLDSIFGTPNWRDELYKTQVFTDLFAETISTATRNVTQQQIEAYSRKRLGTLFRYVSEPLPLIAEGRGHLFSLFCLSNSSSDKAIDLIKKGVRSTLNKFGSASRRKSGR